MWKRYLSHLTLQILFERGLFFGRKGIACPFLAREQIECDAVSWVNAIVTVYLLVDVMCHSSKQIALGHIAIECCEESVYTLGAMIMNGTFIANNTRLHAQHIVLRTLFKVGRVAFLLHLLGFKEIAGVVFIRNGQRHNV